MKQSPRVSIIMSVYNGEPYLKESIESILNQTYNYFEFIILNDGSTDNSRTIIEAYKDPRIRLINQKNIGLTASLNKGLGLAKGEYIARQDADDVSLPTRLKQEVDYLDSHPSVGLVGSNYLHIDEKGAKTGARTHVFTHPEDLRVCLVLCNQYGHGSVMLRRKVVEKVGQYDSRVGHAEDYDLWVRISRKWEVANIEEPLYLYRNLPTSVSHSKLDEQVILTFAIRDKAFQHFLENRKLYSLFSFHPGGKSYFARKATLYRDFAYLAVRSHKFWLAFQCMLAATLCQPFLKKNYRYILAIFSHGKRSQMEFEFL